MPLSARSTTKKIIYDSVKSKVAINMNTQKRVAKNRQTLV